MPVTHRDRYHHYLHLYNCHHTLGVHYLAHAPQRVAEEVAAPRRVLLGDVAVAVEVGVRAVAQHLREAGLQVHGEGGGGDR